MIRKPMQKDSGQVLVIVALLMVVLFSVSAVAVDIGIEINAVNHLKNMASVSALAGATVTAQGNDQTVTDAVYASLKANDGITLPYQVLIPVLNRTSVQVSLTQQHHFFLAPILGYSSTTITQSATATLSPPSGSGASPFNYALFSDQPLILNPKAYITGGVHCNSTVSLNLNTGSPLSYFTGGIEDRGGVTYNANAIDATKTLLPFNNNATSIPIAVTPDPTLMATNLYREALNKGHVVTSTNWSGPNGTLQPNSGEAWNSSLGYQWTYNNGTFSVSGSNPQLLDGPWYFEGNLSVSPGGSFTVYGAVAVTGQIQLGGGQLSSISYEGSTGLAFYSLLGSPQFPNTNNLDCITASISSKNTSTITGSFYAPYGTIKLNGGIPVITGSVIGKTVTTTNGITITYDPDSFSNQVLIDAGLSSLAYLTN